MLEPREVRVSVKHAAGVSITTGMADEHGVLQGIPRGLLLQDPGYLGTWTSGKLPKGMGNVVSDDSDFIR